MGGMRIPSINLLDIDFEKCYFNPGCALSVYKPASEVKILQLLREYFGTVTLHNVCCKHEPKLPHGATIINNCAGCDRRFRSLYEGIQTISLWEVLNSIDHFPLPSHEGLTVSVHDPCSYRPKPQVHGSVRSLLKKMDVEIIEAPCSGTRSICCGDNFYPRLSIERVTELQQKRAAQMPCEQVAVYCVSCINSMIIGSKKPRHLVDLVLNEETEPNEVRIDAYHDLLDIYIEEH